MSFQKKVLLKNYSSYKIGGPAKFFAEAGSVGELEEILRSAQDDIFVLGEGTNILISDQGFDGLVIHNRIKGIERKDANLRVGSGVLVKDFLDYCLKSSLSGFEWAGGLPGTMGGAVRGNAGAFKGETKDSVVKVESLDTKTLSGQTRNNTQCQFAYRNSIFKSGEGVNEFITYVTLRLTSGNKKEIGEKIAQKIDYRNNRHPMDFPSIGSMFKNISLDSLSNELRKEFSAIVKTDPFPLVPVTKLLAFCGLRGRRVGGAMISDKHPNFIINVDNAKSKDVKTLIEIAKQAVKEKYKIILEEEIIYLS